MSYCRDKMLLVTLICILFFSNGHESASVSKVKSVSSDQLGCVKCHGIDKNKVNVHLVPHSHDDVGWLKTVDQYFYGTNNEIQQASVQNIITSVVEALLENPERRYIQVETAYFWKWWKSQTDIMRENFKSLVDNGQIEIVNGAWAMNDEACTNYQSTIDQFTWGLRIINDTIGTCGVPRVGWQIDPFGHSREQASLFAQFGFDGVFFARLDHDDRSQREKTASFDFAWQGSANLEDSVIFGGIFPTPMYNPPSGYCWDWGCDDMPVIDNKESADYNADSLIETFKLIIELYKTYLPTNNMLIPMGGDFHYEAAEKNFINMDRFIKAFTDDEDLNVIYSTPSCYIQAVNEAKPTLKLKTDDFFPYSNDDRSFWTGYFTSRPNSKRFERQGHNILQAAKQLMALSEIHGADYEINKTPLEDLRNVMGIMQHHDAITGTEKQHVVDDYVRMLTRAIETAEQPLGEVIGGLLAVNGSTGEVINLNLTSCLLSNVSICSPTQNSEKFVVAVYNPLAWNATHYVRLPVNDENYVIEGPDGKEKYDIVQPIPYFSTKLEKLQSDRELVFAARDVPPMGIKLYYVSATTSMREHSLESNTANADNLSFGDKATNFQIDPESNLLTSVTMNGITLNITQEFYFYTSEGDLFVSPGAYLFRPMKTTPEYFESGVTNVTEVRGELVDEFHQRWDNEYVKISQVIRVYKKENYIEFDWLVGDIDISTDYLNKEVITKYTITSINNNGTFYTDSNGREMIKRTLNSRPDYSYDPTKEPVASNYYPITSKIVIKDSNTEVAILTDRPQGGSSLNDGEVELMLHRRLNTDDDKGVGENLDEVEFGTEGVYVRGTHYLIIGSATKLNPDGRTTAAQERILAQKKLVQPWIGVADATSDAMTYDHLQENLIFNYSALTKSLPENINILTFEPWKLDSYLLRLEHILEKDEDPSLSAITTVDLNDLFDFLHISEITETTLAANEWLHDYQAKAKYTWNVTGKSLDVISKEADPSSLKFSLGPMRIRTFVVKFNDHSSGGFGHVVKPVPTAILFTVLMYLLF